VVHHLVDPHHHPHPHRLSLLVVHHLHLPLITKEVLINHLVAVHLQQVVVPILTVLKVTFHPRVLIITDQHILQTTTTGLFTLHHHTSLEQQLLQHTQGIHIHTVTLTLTIMGISIITTRL